MYDTIFSGGTLVSEETGVVVADLAVSRGRIAALLAPGSTAEAVRRVDVRGLHVLPGAVDPHIHIGHGAGHAQDFATESRSAAIGGVTSYLTYFRKAPYDYERLLPELIELGNSHSLTDFAVHLVLQKPENLESIPRYMEQGVTSFKFFFGHQDTAIRDITALPHTGAFLSCDDGFFVEAFNVLARNRGALAIAHCENSEVNRAARAAAEASGATGLGAWSDSRPDYSETEGIRRACLWAEMAGIPIYIVHVGSARSAAEVRRQRATMEITIYAETLIQYLTMTKEDPIGVLAKMNPPIRTEADRRALWDATVAGEFDTLSSDHGAFLRSEKTEVWSSRTGTPSAGLVLPGLLTERQRTGKLSLVDVARLTSTNAARIFGLHPQKGTFRIGADADLAIVDLRWEQTVTAELMQSRSDFSVFEGRKLIGWPRYTVSRGEVVVEEGAVRGKEGWGRYLHRPLSGDTGGASTASPIRVPPSP